MESPKKKKLLIGTVLSISVLTAIFIIDYYLYDETEFAIGVLKGFVTMAILLSVLKGVNGKNDRKRDNQ
jgi:hypothetical protein